MARHVHPRPDETHTFPTQPTGMRGESRGSARAHDPMTWNLRVVALPQRVAYGASREWTSGDHADESVGGDAARWYALDDRVHGP
jgi:hypothetical protein